MIHNKLRSSFAAICCSAALIGGLAACGDDDSSTSSGGSTIKVDGEQWDGDFTTSCTESGDSLILAITETSNDAGRGAGATLTKADNSVQVVAIGDAATQGGLAYNSASPDSKPKVEKDGQTYTITGEATALDMTNPTDPKKSSFELVFSC